MEIWLIWFFKSFVSESHNHILLKKMKVVNGGEDKNQQWEPFCMEELSDSGPWWPFLLSFSFFLFKPDHIVWTSIEFLSWLWCNIVDCNICWFLKYFLFKKVSAFSSLKNYRKLFLILFNFIIINFIKNIFV